MEIYDENVNKLGVDTASVYTLGSVPMQNF
jgi:hypothetical protein